MTRNATMTLPEARDWLVRWLLIAAIATAVYLLCPLNIFLIPLNWPERLRALEILQPVLIGQLLIAYRWYGTHLGRLQNTQDRLPAFIVRGPLIGAAILVALGVVGLAIGNLGGDTGLQPGTAEEATWHTSDIFTAILGFAALLLNSTTVVIMRSFFAPDEAQQRPQGPDIPSSGATATSGGDAHAGALDRSDNSDAG